MLGGMYSGFQGCRPAGRVNSGTFVFRAFNGLPVDKEGDRVFGLWDTIVRFASCDSCCCTGDNSSWNSNVLKNPAAYVNMVGGQIVAALPSQVLARGIN